MLNEPVKQIKEAWKYIDWLTDKGIPPNKYKITNTGEVYSITQDEPLLQRTYKNRAPSVALTSRGYPGKLMKTSICVPKAVLICFGDNTGIDVNSRSLKVGWKDNDKTNNHISNLYWDLKGDFSIREKRMLIDIISNNMNLSIPELVKMCSEIMGVRVAKHHIQALITDCTRKTTAFGALKIDPGFRRDPEKNLTEKEVKFVSELILKYSGNTNNVYDECVKYIPDISKDTIRHIRNKQTYTDISDEYFENPVIPVYPTTRHDWDKEFPDLPNEIWKQIDFLPKLKDEIYYVSNKGRIKNRYGRVLKCSIQPNEPPTVTFSDGTGHKYDRSGFQILVSKVVAMAFLPLPEGVIKTDSLSVKNIDGNLFNNDSTNLKWYIVNSKFSIDDLLKIREIVEQYPYEPFPELSKIILDQSGIDINDHSLRGFVNDNLYDFIDKTNIRRMFKERLSTHEVENICEKLVQYNGDINKVMDELEKNGVPVSYGIIYSIKSKRYFSEISDKYFVNNEFRNKSKRIIQKCDLDGNIICEYDSIADLLRECPYVSRKSLYRHADKKGKYFNQPYQGFIWRYRYE